MEQRGQPPKCRNSLHTHRTAEVFLFYQENGDFLGKMGKTGEVILEPGDIFNIPTGILEDLKILAQTTL